MFASFFKKNEKKTGIYKIENNNLIEIDETPGNGSINSIIEHFGYPTNLVHVVLAFDSNKIECLGFKVLTKELIFVLQKSDYKKISYSDVMKEISNIDWKFEYDSLKIEDVFNDAVKEENLSVDFLKSISSDLTLIKDNVYQSEKFGLFFYFENNILKSFDSTGYDSTATKWFKNINPNMYQHILKEANLYHGREENAMKEVNLQCEAMLDLPDGVKNEFVNLHVSELGNVNFYNILITHYNQDCELEDFLIVNKGRLKKYDSKTFAVGDYIYEFDENNHLTKSRTI